MAAVTVTGAGGVTVGGDSRPIGFKAGSPPELHTSQWGIYRIDLQPLPAERVGS
jgi:hypothetical protein